jgi:response regulator of citrate/malate metabolism
MNGLELMETFKSANMRCEFILTSAVIDEEMKRRFLSMGGIDYLKKPYDQFELEYVL